MDLHGMREEEHQGLGLERFHLPLTPSRHPTLLLSSEQAPGTWTQVDFLQQDSKSQDISAGGTLVVHPLLR